VYQENWEAVMMFLKIQTQWRVGMGGIIGLDYTSVIEMIKLYKDKPLDLMESIQVIEASILKTLNRENK
tara:strand:- start:105 stop:311 length:207 start_codon:yes stop_codon:yes gene_type:complete